jgi:hypothetical protein
MMVLEPCKYDFAFAVQVVIKRILGPAENSVKEYSQ